MVTLRLYLGEAGCVPKGMLLVDGIDGADTEADTGVKVKGDEEVEVGVEGVEVVNGVGGVDCLEILSGGTIPPVELTLLRCLIEGDVG